MRVRLCVGPTQVARITLATSVDQTDARNAGIQIALGVDRRGVLRLELRGALSEEAIAELLKRRVERPETGSRP
jgi:hypothetical protein